MTTLRLPGAIPSKVADSLALPWHIAEKVATNIEPQNPRSNGAKELKKTGFQSPSELLRLEAWRMN